MQQIPLAVASADFAEVYRQATQEALVVEEVVLVPLTDYRRLLARAAQKGGDELIHSVMD